MTCPIAVAKALTPWWMMKILRFDGLEIHPCREVREPGETPFTEQCAPEEAEFWSVYGHARDGGVECFEDFPAEDEARAFAERLLKAYPHLGTFGLLG